MIVMKVFCERCWDVGKIGLFFKKVCPECLGDPQGHWEKLHPRPAVPPKAGTGAVSPKQEIHIYHHFEGKK